MAQYTVIFGGQHQVEASSVKEAYEQFWQWVKEQRVDKNFGLIICPTVVREDSLGKLSFSWRIVES